MHMKTEHRIENKLKKSAGESLAETLVALLIATFAMLLLVNMNESARRLITNNIDTVEEYQTGNKALTAQGDIAGGSVITATGKVTLYVRGSVNKAGVKLDANQGSEAIPITLFSNPKNFGTPVISYKGAQP